ncbi:HTH-type transcriptional repressor YtrA [Microbacterium oxydans]|uniref:HTH-type transcriptional repressor YtrA n=1 Tax=Microbacterium oxydans TaxID=82380 RepID=A0A0F0L5U9_9MICO|nr:GntR family transcriptional regulator [Microbacterium oxydans]KJL28557.1 HTH-type transcriptional repressor YtrA [Microbacterium oxydans]CAH0232880.1 HTH-type transcriptional repressor YtrA [Microbacterium oxydans]
MLIKVDLSSGAPLYEQVAASVRADIVAGRVSPGDRLPSARELAEALEINLHTVLRAYQQLRDERLIDLRRGRGAVISASAAPLAELSQDISALVGRAAALGLSPATLAALIKETAV